MHFGFILFPVALKQTALKVPALPIQRPIVKKIGGVSPGELVKVHFSVRNAQGKTIADTLRRGLPYRFLVGDTQVDPAIQRAVVGMVPGEMRRLSTNGLQIEIHLLEVQTAQTVVFRR